MILVAPSLLSADFAKLGKEIEEVVEAGADYMHFDVMDGKYVPNLSFGVPVLKSVKKCTEVPFDVHLMVDEPDHLIPEFIKAGADIVTVHYEAVRHIDRTLSLIRSLGAKAGVSINPGTPVSVLKEVLPYVDLVLVMSVNPGFGGQKFIKTSLAKLEMLKKLREENGYDYLIEVDGGVGPANAAEIASAGADILVAGSAVFGSDDYKQAIAAIKG